MQRPSVSRSSRWWRGCSPLLSVLWSKTALRRACWRCCRCARSLPVGPCTCLQPSLWTILVILAGHSGQHVEQHAVDRVEHARRELIAIAGCHDPTRRQIESDDPHLARREFGPQLFPIRSREARQSINLLGSPTVPTRNKVQSPPPLPPTRAKVLSRRHCRKWRR